MTSSGLPNTTWNKILVKFLMWHAAACRLFDQEGPFIRRLVVFRRSSMHSVVASGNSYSKQTLKRSGLIIPYNNNPAIITVEKLY